jgi:hypothetical protein
LQFLYLSQSHWKDNASSQPVRAAMLILLIVLIGDGGATNGQAAATAPTGTDPRDVNVVRRAVASYFEALPAHQPGDLISRTQIGGALASVKDSGWEVPDVEQIVQLGLSDNSFLVRRLSTPAGRKFMRKIAAHPGAYSRLDRLSSLARGQRLVNDLIRQKGGDELIAYLSSTKQGRQLGRQLSATPFGNLNEPTGRIYTADDLLAALKQLWDLPEAGNSQPLEND